MQVFTSGRRTGIPGPLLAASVACLLLVHSKSFASRFYQVVPWGEERGFEASGILATTQTPDGYLWFGAPAGLFRFNGESFRLLGGEKTRDHPGPNITCLTADTSGTLWIGTLDNGLFAFKNNSFTRFGQEKGISNARIKKLFIDAQQVLWVATDGGGAFYHSNNRFVALNAPQHIPMSHPTAFADAPGGGLWIGTYDQGLYHLQDNNWRRMDVPFGSVNDLLNGPGDLLWAATPRGIYRLQDNQVALHDLSLKEGEFSNQPYVYALEQGSDGSLWIATSKGVVNLHEGIQKVYGEREGMRNPVAISLFLDAEENLWVGTTLSVLHQFQPVKVKKLNPFFAHRGSSVNSIYEAKDGAIWLAGMKGLARWKNGNVRVFTEEDGMRDDFVTAISEGPQGRLWFGTRYGGLNYFQNGRFYSAPEPTGVFARAVWCFFQDSTKDFYIGSGKGLAKLLPSDQFIEPSHFPLSSQDVRCIEEDNEGDLWVGTAYGLNRLRKGKWHSYIELKPRKMEVVMDLYCDREGTLWIGTAGSGLFRFKNEEFFNFNQDHGLDFDVACQVLEDDHGHLWVSDGTKAIRLAKDDLNAIADGRLARTDPVRFGKVEGMPSTTMVMGIQPGAIKTKDGTLWFPTSEGAGIIDPARTTRNTRPPPVVVERLIINGEPYEVSDLGSAEAEIPPGYHYVEIEYAALTYITPSTTRFKFRLSGLNEEWQEVGNRRTAYYQALDPGSYTFEVHATNNDGVRSSQPGSIQFTVLAPWWETASFRGLLVFATLAVGLGLYSLRVNRLKQLNRTRGEFSKQLLDRQEMERSHLAKELHDGLGQELLLIANQAQLLEREIDSRKETNLQRTHQIRELAQGAIQSAREITYRLRPAELNRVGLTDCIQAMLNRTAQNSGITVDSHLDSLDEILPYESEVVLYRIVQELAVNILKHSRATRMMVDLLRENLSLLLEIADNGIGFDYQAVMEGKQPGSGLGLKSVRERVEMLQGTIEVESKKGEGTRFRIRIPLKTTQV